LGGEVGVVAFFEDDTPYRYGQPERPGILNAGWLEGGRPYRTGVIETDALHKLAALSLRAEHGHCGHHFCSICPSSLSKKPWHLATSPEMGLHLLGSRVLEVPTTEGEYRAPDLVLHYVLDHYYRPPKAFLESVRRFSSTLEGQSWCLVHGSGPSAIVKSPGSYPDLDALTERAVRPHLIRGQEPEAIEVYRALRDVDVEDARLAVREIWAVLSERRRQEVAEIIDSHGGLATAKCAWQGCEHRALRGMAICADHAYPELP
jgi:hypothetical protein